MIADYDQNGLITAADLTPLGQHFRKGISYDPGLHDGIAYWPTGDPDDGGSGTENWRLARIDGHVDGLLEVDDITPLALHWNAQMTGYVIEHAVNLGTGQWIYDSEYVDIGHGSLPSVPRSVNYLPGKMSVDPNTPVRYSITVPLSDAEHAQYFRVRAYDTATDEVGWESNGVMYLPTTTTDTTPPVWIDTVGVTNLIPSAEQITVEFGTAEDAQSPPVTYRVYWAEGDPLLPDAPFDYVTASTADVTTAPHVITGLTDGQYYRVAVRAMDSADTPNIELNTVVLGSESGATDIYPPEWQGRVGIADLFYGNEMAVVVFDSAIDSHTDEHGTWESGPVRYQICYGPGEEPNWDDCSLVEYTDSELEGYVHVIEGMDTTQTNWFSVRVGDQAIPANVDDNDKIMIGHGHTRVELEFPTAPDSPEVTTSRAYGFITSPDNEYCSFMVEYETATDHCYSLWSFDPGGFIHVEADIISSKADAPKFKLKHASHALDGSLSFVYQADNIYKGDLTFVLYKGSDLSRQTFTLHQGNIEAAGVNSQGNHWVQLHAVTNDDLFNPEFTYYLTWLPYDSLTPTWISPEDDELFFVRGLENVAAMDDGSMVMGWKKQFYDMADEWMIVELDDSGVSIQPYIPSLNCNQINRLLGSNTPAYTLDESDGYPGQSIMHISRGEQTWTWESAPPLDFNGSSLLAVATHPSFTCGVRYVSTAFTSQPGTQYILSSINYTETDVILQIPYIDEEYGIEYGVYSWIHGNYIIHGKIDYILSTSKIIVYSLT